MEILKIRKLTVAVVMFFLCTAHQTRGISGYLKQIGPSPLRFSLVNAIHDSFILPESLVERQAPTNSTEIAASTTTSTGTNALSVHSPLADAPSSNPSVDITTHPQNSSAPKPAASDLLVVSPQMLTEFFKPVGDGTNSPGNATAPLPVGFTPPSAPPSSRATYNSP